MKDKYPKNYLLLMAVSVFCLIAIVFSSSYAYFKARIVNNTNPFELIGGTIKLQLNENSISGEKLLPILDSQKDTNAQIKNFTVKRTDDSNIDVCYNVYLVIESISDNIKNSKYMKYELTNGSSTTTGNFSTAAYQDGKAIILLAQNKYLSKTNTTGDAYSLKIWLSYDGSVDQTSLLGGNFSAHIYAQGNSGNTCPGSIETKYTLYDKLLADNPVRSTRSNNNNGTNDFATPLTTTTTGTLFKSTESITGITTSPKEVYYYAGNTTNNWVKFAGLYWRIIRTNHDGSIRLLYVGTSHDTTTGNIGESAFNTSYDSPKYVGYKYGEDTSLDTIRNNTTNSTIKTFIDSWYKNNLTNYTKYLSTSAVYCNDRSEGTGQTYSASSDFKFAPYYRMDYNTDGAKANPSYNCTDIRDAFSVENTSAKLDYPVSLMTADEIAFAGGVAFQTMNTPYAWFISNSVGTQVSTYWWSLSPSHWSLGSADVWYWISDSAALGSYYVDNSYAVRPAISLKSCIKYSTGDGTSESPYEIVETSSGC